MFEWIQTSFDSIIRLLSTILETISENYSLYKGRIMETYKPSYRFNSFQTVSEKI
jgi:hypothetical protein